MGIDIDLLDKIVEKVEGNVIDKIRQVPIQKLFRKMNDLTVLLYLLCFAIVVGMTFAFMYAMMNST